jgi:putative hydrolase of HD superfamily
MNSALITDEILGIVQFLRDAERLKNVYRTSWTAGGQRESSASHTWRLCLGALVFAHHFPEVNVERLLKMCIIHDLGEAIGGDIPAIHQNANTPKAGQERRDLLTILQPLPTAIQQEIIGLWDEYEAATTPEAKVAKALDKLETLMQHNQGANPPDFDYLFNIDYARKFTDAVPLIAKIRQIIDEETRQNALRYQCNKRRTLSQPDA